MMDETPKELIINFDQTALNYVSATPWTLEKQGTKRIEVIGKGDKWQLSHYCCIWWDHDGRFFYHCNYL